MLAVTSRSYKTLCTEEDSNLRSPEGRQVYSLLLSPLSHPCGKSLV